MKLKLLISLTLPLFFVSCASNNEYYIEDKYSNDLAVKKHEALFEKEVKSVFLQIDNNKTKIRTVEEKEKFENRVVDKPNINGSENYFRKNVLQRFKQ